ncbi:MAG: DUF3052 domain-containing protein [Pseudomonadota bacterium]
MAKPVTHGYSGKPLFQKLGIKPGMRCLTIKAPAHYDQLIAGHDDANVSNRLRSAEMVHLFCRHRADLDKAFPKVLDRISDGGMLWVSWPKKSSDLFEDLTEDTLREVILPTGWVDVKVCAVDSDWSALKFLKRRK